MSYLNITIKNEKTGDEKKASIPKRTAEGYILATSIAANQEPNKLHLYDEGLKTHDLEKIFNLLILTSKRNVRLWIEELKGVYSGNDTYAMTISVDNDPISKYLT